MIVACNKRSISGALPYTIAFLIPISATLGPILGGIFWYATPILGFVVIPVMDFIFGDESFQPNESDEITEKDSMPYKLLTWIYAPVHIGITGWGAWYYSVHSMTIVEASGLLLSVGISSGALGFTVGHELAHRGNRFERSLSVAILSFTNYTHFIIEHCVGHHARVATPADPASSRLGENLYAFLPRTVYGGWTNAWSYEEKRVSKHKGIKKHLANRMLHYTFLQALINLGFILFLGLEGWCFFFFVSIISVLLLEVINYIEHYGLRREMVDKDRQRYEKVQPHHSWNANHKISNLFLFRLQRHSDHHAHPLRRYQLLRSYHQVPQLPYGYPTMTLLAFIPSLWSLVMDPRVAAARKNSPSPRR